MLLFQLGVQIALVSCQPEIDTIIAGAGLENVESTNLLKMTLSNYFSACFGHYLYYLVIYEKWP